jgi:HK97 gp10 family phage protein
VAEIRLTGVDNVLDMLASLPKEVVAKRGGPVRRALRKGALVIQKEAVLNIARAVDALGSDDHESTGLLQGSVIVTRGKPPAGENGERYLVRVKSKKYNRKGKTVTTQMTGRLLEYGSSQQPAEPWLRPAFASKAVQAINTTTSELLKDIDRIVKKLGKQGGLS